MKTVYNYPCTVDGYRRPGRKRNTAGTYIVAAKTKKEAKILLQNAIGFGSVVVLKPRNLPSDFEKLPKLKYKDVKKLEWKAGDGKCTPCYSEPVKATAFHKRKE